MTNEEFSNEFDTLINSNSAISLNGMELPLEFDEYEKSVFLTKAQEEVVQGLYTGKITGDSFETTEQLRRYLADLVSTAELPCRPYPGGLSNKSVFAVLPDDLWFITYESVTLNGDTPCLGGKEIQVVPVTQDEYHRVKDNPFRGPNSRRVLRLDVNESMVELISKQDIRSYLVRYLSRPTPIILLDLPDGLSINNIKTETECKLNPGIHRTILEVAVNLAIKSRVSSTGK